MCISINQSIYLAIPSMYLVTYTCIYLLCSYSLIHTDQPMTPSIQHARPNNPFPCVYLLYLHIHSSIRTNVPIPLRVSAYPYLSIPPHAPISIRSITDCSEGWKEGGSPCTPTLVTWGPRVGTAPAVHWWCGWGAFIACLPVTEWRTATEARRSPRFRMTRFARPCPVDEVNSSKAAHTGQSLDALGSHQVVCR